MYNVIIAIVGLLVFVGAYVAAFKWSENPVTCINQKKFFIALSSAIVLLAGWFNLNSNRDAGNYLNIAILIVGWLMFLALAVPTQIDKNGNATYDPKQLLVLIPGILIVVVIVWYVVYANMFTSSPLLRGLEIGFVLLVLTLGTLLAYSNGKLWLNVLALTLPGAALVVAGAALLYMKGLSEANVVAVALFVIGWIFISAGISQYTSDMQTLSPAM